MNIAGVPAKQFTKEVIHKVSEDNVSNGAAALAYYLLFSLFPAMIFMLTLLPYLPIENLGGKIMDALSQAMPGDAAKMFTGVVREVTQNQKGGLLSLGLLLTAWSASSGQVAVMQQLNITYEVKEGRPYWKVRLVALGLTLMVGALMVGALLLTLFGGTLHDFLESRLHIGTSLTVAYQAFRWAVTAAAVLLAFALTYYFAPDVKQKWKWISPGAIAGGALLVVATLGFKFYVDNFGKFNATYGSLGAGIVLILWLYIAGLVVLVGSEVNVVTEAHTPGGKDLGDKVPEEDKVA